jgi:murein DD-endopeptidase MepM/ murein hydrolase activator NlpD
LGKVVRLFLGCLRAGLALVAFVAILVTVHWAISDRLPPTLQHPVAAWRLVRSEPPAHLPVPVDGVLRSQLRDTWGAPRPGERQHQGIDIFAPRGRRVLSTTAGIVLSVGENALGGRVVRVLGPGGHWHYYAHLDAYGAIGPGDIVAAGTVLGFVGNTGNARGTPPHLHYGIYQFAGGPLNPYPLLVREQ